jgi:hypothetical protein
MNELEETVLAICTWLSKVDYSSWIVKDNSFGIDSFAVALHVQLLDMGCKFAKGLTIGDNGSCSISLYCCTVKTYQAKQ